MPFKRTSYREGYDCDEVDAFLTGLGRGAADVAPTPRTSALAQRIEAAVFTPVRLKGYDMADVDRLLDRIAEAAESGHDLQALVDDATLRRVRFREGYDIDEVDRFLGDLSG